MSFAPLLVLVIVCKLPLHILMLAKSQLIGGHIECFVICLDSEWLNNLGRHPMQHSG